MSIQPLSPDVVAQIKSSVTISSLNGVTCELFKNCLDADATKVDITVDYSRGSCSVEDDGIGILPLEFRVDGHLGKLHHTSKLNTQVEVHGRRGMFLASLSAMALVSITSRHHLHRSHNTLTLHKSEVASRETPAPLQQHLASDHGARVTVRDLFGNMPVRVKHRALVAEKGRGNSKDWENLKQDIVALLLPWRRTVAVTIRNSQTNQKMSIRPSSMLVQSGKSFVPSVCSILSQASMISRDQKDSWIPVHASTPSLDISGTISLDPTANKSVQFFCLGIQPLVSSDGQTVFHDEINRLFASSAFGIEEEAQEIDSAEQKQRMADGRYHGDRYTSKELKGAKRGVDRWPMFFICVQLTGEGKSRSRVEDILDEKSQSLESILEVLRLIILKFLTKYRFSPKGSNDLWSTKEFDPVLSTTTKLGTDAEGSLRNRPQLRTKDSKERAQAKARKCSVRTKSRPDPLGTNTRLPSFRQGALAAELPFDSWSRVKRGAVSRPATPKMVVEDLDGVQIPRPATAPPYLTNGPSMSEASIPRGSRVQPLLSKNGKIVQAPFIDVASHIKPRPHPMATGLLPPAVENTAVEHADEIVVWVNPLTKVRSFVNQRTGLTIKAGITCSQAIQQPRLTTFRPGQIPSQPSPSPWISDMLKMWDNPIFAPAEPSIPQISFNGPDATTQNILHGHHHHCSQIDIDRAFSESSSGINGRVSKEALVCAEIISQVDEKFILVKLQSIGQPTSASGVASMLVLIDQHAADERIRVEALMEELCSPPSSNSSATVESSILTSALAKPLHFDLSEKEIQLLQIHQSHFSNWGIIYTISPSMSKSQASPLTVHSLPPSILERCQTSPRILIDLIRTDLWKVHDKHATPAPPLPPGDWLRRIHSCPQGILDMINSRACRSAIMFNDVLSKEQCEILVRRLSECKFPFQCAHGRPSLVPLVDLMGLGLGSYGLEEEKTDFAARFRNWKGGEGQK